jgi:hypothetical protein
MDVYVIAWIICVPLSLWRYFDFVYFDPADFQAARRTTKIWGLIVAFLMPLIGLNLSQKLAIRHHLLAIGITAILVPAIVPQMEPEPALSAREWLSNRVQWWVGDFVIAAFIYALCVACALFGQQWLTAYFVISFILGLGRCFWLRIQGSGVPRAAAPSVLTLVIVFLIVFSWAGQMALAGEIGAIGWQEHVSDFFKSTLEATLWAWIVGRWPLIGLFRKRA